MGRQGDNELPETVREEVHQGVRRWITRTRDEKPARGRAKRWTANAVLGTLAASALAPIFLAVASGGIGSEVFQTLTNVGTNILSDLIGEVAAKARTRKPSAEEVEADLLQAIRAVLEADNDDAIELRSELAHLLRVTDAQAVVQKAAVDGELTGAAEALKLLSAQFSEFAFIGEALSRIERTLRSHSDVLHDVSARLGQIRETQLATTALTPISTARMPPGCPYKGLEPYDEDDFPLFHGREKVTDDLIKAMAAKPAGPSLLLLAGASGSGKTSLLRAGLAACLARGHDALPEAARWPRATLTPTASPLSELIAHLTAVFGAGAAASLERLTDEPHRAHELIYPLLLQHAEGGRAGRLILIIDQFEEIFTIAATRSPDQVTTLLEILRSITEKPVGPEDHPPAVVVLGLRDDFWGHCTRHKVLNRAQNSQSFTLGPMEDDQRLRAITGPAEEAGLELEAGLTDMIMDDLRSRPNNEGALPLLSQAMLMTWRQREGNRLTRHGYAATGGVEKAVFSAAEEVYRSLPSHQQNLIPRLFQRLTELTYDGHVRRAIRVDDAKSRAVLEKFAAMRLVVLRRDEAEISHDVLLRAWPRLREWLKGDEQGRLLVAELNQDAQRWKRNARDRGSLYGFRRLRRVKKVLARWNADDRDRYPRLEPASEAFLTASYRKVRRTGVMGLVVAVTVPVIAGAAWVRLNDARAASEAHSLAETIINRSHAVRQSDPLVSGLLAAASWQIRHSDEARQGMLDFLATTAHAVMPASSAAAFSPDGDTLVTTGAGDTIEVWDVRTRRMLGTLPDAHTGAVYHTLFSPDGKVLASVGQDHKVRLWDVSSRKPIAAPIMPVPDVSDADGRVDTVGFSPDGTLIAVATLDYRIRFYEVATGRPVGRPLSVSSDARMTAFGPNGRTVIVREGATVSLWDRVTGRRSRAVPVKADLPALGGGVLATYHGGEIRLWRSTSLRPLGAPIRSGKIDMLAVSLDGSTLATATDRSVQYWDIRTHRLTGTTVTGHRDTITSLGFTTDGTRLWTLAGDDTGRLWNTRLLAEVGDPIALSTAETPFERDSRVLSFSPEGHLLTVAVGDELQQWTTRAERAPALPAGTFAVSPDGRTVAVEEAGRLVLEDRDSGHRTGASLPLPDAAMRLIAFSPDWRAVAISSKNDIQVWDPATGHPLSPVMTGHGEGYSGYDPDGTVVAGPIDGIVDMAFSPDRTTLVSAGVDGVLRFWDVATGRSTRENAYVEAVRIDSDGRYAVTLSLDPTDESFGEIGLWDLATRKHVGTPWPAHAGGGGAAAFSTDGRVLATGGRDGEIRLWDVSTRRAVGNPIKAHPGAVTSVVFSPDGKILASAGDDGTVRLWATDLPADPRRAVCAVAGRSLTKEEWQRYLPGTPAPEDMGCGSN
ncbi:NACHT and WD repeat domain-containing protein [Microbispora bryophytorum]|uniref:NACHT and WD repeat domain-containing protein n=1 Tax=Microbispora bryophytorum TaxID=1460882 RepID=UPI0033D8AB2C